MQQQQQQQQQQHQQQYRFHLIEGNPADRRKRKRTSSLATVLTISEDIGSGFDDEAHHHVMSSDMEMTQKLRFNDEGSNNTSSQATPSRRWYMYQPVKRRNSITTSSEQEQQEEEDEVTENAALSSIASSSSSASALYHHHQTNHVSITDSSSITTTTIHTRNSHSSHNEQHQEQISSSNPSIMGDEGHVHYHSFGVNPPPPNTTAGDPACSRNRTNSLPPYPLHSRCNNRSNIIVLTDHRIQQAVEQAQENLSHRSRQRLNPSSRTTPIDTIGILPTEESELVVEETDAVLLSPNSAELERKKKALKRISIANLLN